MIDRIYCRNFRRIGECDLPLRDGITVLIGNNGAGKSSIVESVTFALYGRTSLGRGGTDDRRSNAAEKDATYVSVDFTINGTHYRCRRWFSGLDAGADIRSYTDEEYQELQKRPVFQENTKMKKYNDDLGELLVSGSNGTTDLSAEIIGVSYDGFLASFFARQKELNALASIKGPEERKAFFLNILGYQKLDAMKKNIGSETRATKSLIDSLSNQNYSIPQLEKTVAHAEKEVKTLDERVVKGRKCVEDAEKKLSDASVKYENVRVLSEQVSQATKMLVDAQKEQTRLMQEIDALDKNIAENKKKSEGYDANSSIADKLADANDRMQKANQLIQLTAKREEAEGAYISRQKEHEQNIARIKELEELTKTEPSTTPLIEKITNIKEQISANAQERKTAELGYNKITSLLNSVNSGEIAECPSCGTEISSQEGKDHLSQEIKTYEKQMKECDTKSEQLNKDLSKTQESLDFENQRLRTYNMNINEKTRLQGQDNDLSKYIQENQKTIEQYKKEEAELIKYKLNQDEKFKLNEEIITLKQQREREDIMKKAYYQVQTDNEVLKNKQIELNKTLETIKEKQAFISANQKEAGKITKIADEKDHARATRDKYNDCLMDLMAKLSDQKALMSASQTTLKSAYENEAALIKHKQTYDEQVGAQEVINVLRANLPSRIAPRLADISSHLLDIATNGRYTMLEITDSYDIKVYTDDKVRSLNAMSGGEADVISLCIRVGIAKMLLESSGMISQSFILDEIFGALDDERRQSVCTALQGIQSELSKILCITHIDEIKDMADYSFVVEMDENDVSYVREITNGNTLKSVFVEELIAAEENN